MKEISLFQVKIVPFRSTLTLLVILRHSASFLFILLSNLPLYGYGGDLICPPGEGQGHFWVLARPLCEDPSWAGLAPGLGALCWCPCSVPRHIRSLGSPAAYRHHVSHVLPLQSPHTLWLLCLDPKVLLDHWCSQNLSRSLWDKQGVLRCLCASSSPWEAGNIFLGSSTWTSPSVISKLWLRCQVAVDFFTRLVV